MPAARTAPTPSAPRRRRVKLVVPDFIPVLSSLACRLCRPRSVLPGGAAIDRLRLGEEGREYVLHQPVVLLLEACMRDAGHHGELLVRVGQKAEELEEVVEPG